jgi:inosine-uridine nucleoside N-ribohydrolase
MSKRPLIIDCDPGVDDAIALFTAFQSPEFDLLAITTVAGNVGIEHTTRNALQLCEVAGVDVVVAKGAERPLFRTPVFADHVHGKTGLRTLVLPAPKKAALPNAIEVIRDAILAHPNEIEILAVGPLTNLAQVFLLDPTLPPLIKSITIMGGGHRHGNMTPAGEFNIVVDPEAARIVFEAGVPLYMVGLDVTMADGLKPSEIDQYFTTLNPQTKVIHHILKDMVYAEGKNYKEAAYIHDAMALLYMLQPDILQGDWYHVDLETKSSISYGKTVVDYYHVTKKPKNVWVALGLDAEKYKKALKERLHRYQ